MKNDAANTRSGEKPATANHSEPPVALMGSRPLRNWKHEKFAVLVVGGTGLREAYVMAGFEPIRSNENRLVRKATVKARIDFLRRARELAARAARVPLDQVLGELDCRGIIRIEDLFERNAAGIVEVRNLEIVPVEVAMAFLKTLGEGFGIRER